MKNKVNKREMKKKDHKVAITPGEQIKDALEVMQISQNELAKQLGVSATSVSQWIDNKRNPKPHHRKQLCELLDLDIYEFQGMERPDEMEYLTEQEKVMLSHFRNMDALQRRSLVKLLETFRQKELVNK